MVHTSTICHEASSRCKDAKTSTPRRRGWVTSSNSLSVNICPGNLPGKSWDRLKIWPSALRNSCPLTFLLSTENTDTCLSIAGVSNILITFLMWCGGKEERRRRREEKKNFNNRVRYSSGSTFHRIQESVHRRKCKHVLLYYRSPWGSEKEQWHTIAEPEIK